MCSRQQQSSGTADAGGAGAPIGTRAETVTGSQQTGRPAGGVQPAWRDAPRPAPWVASRPAWWAQDGQQALGSPQETGKLPRRA